MAYYLIRTGHSENNIGERIILPLLSLGGKVLDQTKKAYVLDGISYEDFNGICREASVWMGEIEYGEIERGSPDIGLEF